MSFDVVDLSSISGVILATMFGMEILKRLFQTNKGFGKLPPWVYAIIIAESLTFLAHYGIKDENGLPILLGRTQTLLWRAFLAASSASGFYTWLNNRKSIADAQPLGQENTKPVQLGTTTTTEAVIPKQPGEVPSVTTNSTTSVTKTLGILLVLSLFVGCSNQTQLQKAYTARSLYANGVQTLIQLRQAGTIDDSAYQQIEVARASADTVTKKWEDLALAGQTINFEAFAMEEQKALDDFLAWIIRTQSKN